MFATRGIRRFSIAGGVGLLLCAGFTRAQVPPAPNPAELVCCPGIDLEGAELGCQVTTRAACADLVEAPLPAGLCCPLPIVAEACTGNACDTGLPGLCAPGAFECQQDGTLACLPLAEPSAETCNGSDDDCNGEVDDGLGSTTCGTGECEVTVANCVDGRSQTCTPGSPSAETCDGLDNDCNGIADDGNPGSGASCDTGQPGVCAAGTTDCQNGALVCTQIVEPSVETCDGVDEDCNGIADDGNPGGGQSCDTGEPGVCSAGTTSCANGAIVCDQTTQPSGETCDGLDNNCDGGVDEGLGTSTCGTGQCEVTVENCVDGASQSCVPGSPSLEVCDGLDNDCDGETDESCLFTFTNCGATGATGPSQAACDAEYAGTPLAGGVTLASGIQQWVVPSDGTYRIEAFGAQGESAAPGRAGGRGARVRGDFALTAGETVAVLVGQAGTEDAEANGTTWNGGGGGGSFVVLTPASPLVVAGGGGGTRRGAQQDGCDGRITAEGGTGSGTSAGHSCPAKSGGTGLGGVASASSWGSGGGGFSGNGASDPRGEGGRAFVNGGRGGLEQQVCVTGVAAGGFGGGGSGEGCAGGGGGGGYSGGDGGLVAGGGGSYNGGANPSGTGGAREGHGLVTITLIAP